MNVEPKTHARTRQSAMSIVTSCGPKHVGRSRASDGMKKSGMCRFIVLSTSSEEVGDGTGLYGDSSVRSSDGVCDETLSPSDSVLGAKGNGWARL